MLRTSSAVNAWLIITNRAYYGLQNHMKSSIISRNIKTFLYKTLIRPVLTYGAETWVLSKQDEHRLSIFERKILQRIYGPVTDGGRWRIRTKNSINYVVRMMLWNSASWVDWDGQTCHTPGWRFFQESPPQWARRKVPQRETHAALGRWSEGRHSKARV